MQEPDHEAYVQRLAEYTRLTHSMYVFVRVERPSGSRRFVMGYVRCDRVVSFAHRLREMRLRLNTVPQELLADMDKRENESLRLACFGLGGEDFEKAMTVHIDSRDWGGVKLPPLSAAIYAEDKRSTKALLDNDADPNDIDENGRTALHIAAWKGCSPHALRKILDQVNHVNAKDNDRWTALMLAARFNQLEVVIALMNTPGIDLNAKGGPLNDGTALHQAVLQSHPDIVAQLRADSRADLNVRDRWHRTPGEIAVMSGHGEIRQMFLQHGAPEEDDGEDDDENDENDENDDLF